MGVRGIRRKGGSPIKMNVESILNYADSEKLIGTYSLDIDKLIRNYNIQLKSENLPPEISGKLNKNEDNIWTISINKQHSLSRQRYTIAHEFAHYCLHRNDNSDFEDTSFFRKEENKTMIEYEANQFAAELLMPEEKIKAAIDNDILTLKDLSEAFGVSLIAMKNRLSNLGYKLIGNE